MSVPSSSESVEEFRRRAAAWMVDHLPSWDDPVADGHELQQRLFDHGFAGIAYPREYGGAGLTIEHHKAFVDATTEARRQIPNGSPYRVSIGMLGPTLLEHGSHEAKLRFLPPLLRGDEIWIQLLSEPGGGSDMAGVTTRLMRDGDQYVLNGAKMWSSGALRAHFGLCLCRSDWSLPKHGGLSMIAVPLKDVEGLTVRQTRAVDGNAGEFCEEFFDDVVLPVENLIGDENDGWSVAQTLLRHERNAAGDIGFGYGLLGGVDGRGGGRRFGAPTVDVLIAGAMRSGSTEATAHLLAEAYIESVVGPLTNARIMTGLGAGTHTGHWGSLSKLQSSSIYHAATRIGLAVDGADGVIWDGDDVQTDNVGTVWLGARRGTIAGGTSEIQRNIISERLLGLPREPAPDRGVPFGEVVRR